MNPFAEDWYVKLIEDLCKKKQKQIWWEVKALFKELSIGLIDGSRRQQGDNAEWQMMMNISC